MSKGRVSNGPAFIAYFNCKSSSGVTLMGQGVVGAMTNGL
jgi:hypothetical protein